MAIKHQDLGIEAYTAHTSDRDVIVDVKIGTAANKAGAYAVFFDNVFKAANKPANIGNQKEIIGKTILVSVTIVDLLKETNWTSMTVFIEEGDRSTKYGPYSAEVDNDLDTMVYTLKIANS